MSKKYKVFNYLMKHIEINPSTIEKLKSQPKEAIDYMGGIPNWYLFSCSNYYSECKNAIKYADYKYPDSDQTWEAVEKIKELVVRQKLFMFNL